VNIIHLKITGTRPLLMHNGRLADALDPAAKRLKALTGKRNKTDDDYLAISRVEWDGGLYIDDDGVFIPGENVERCIRDAARMSKDGKKIERGVRVIEDMRLDIGDSPKTADALWSHRSGRHVHRRSARVGMSKVPRTRPVFPEWCGVIELAADDSVIDSVDVIRYATTAGRYIGVGDWRGRFGTFKVEELT